MSWQLTAKSVTTKGSLRKCGERRGKVVALIRGDLSEGRGVVVIDVGSPCDGRFSDGLADRAEVSRGHSSDAICHEGPNATLRMLTFESRRRAECSIVSSATPTT